MPESAKRPSSIKELDTVVQGIEGKVDALAKKLEGLPTSEDLRAIMENMQELMAQPQQAAVAARPVQAPRPVGNYREINAADPALCVEIVMLPAPGRIPKILEFEDKSGGSNLRYTPVFDEKKAAHYYLPRHFAEAQLKNVYGMKFALCWPNELQVSMKGEKQRREDRVFTAHPDYPPIMVTSDGVPVYGAAQVA